MGAERGFDLLINDRENSVTQGRPKRRFFGPCAQRKFDILLEFLMISEIDMENFLIFYYTIEPALLIHY